MFKRFNCRVYFKDIWENFDTAEEAIKFAETNPNICIHFYIFDEYTGKYLECFKNINAVFDNKEKEYYPKTCEEYF